MIKKLSFRLPLTVLPLLFSCPLYAKLTVVDYTCADDKTLSVSYFLGSATKNATAVFENVPHKMYYDKASTPAVMVFREDPYSLHVENIDDISEAVIINITKESQGETLHDLVLFKHCVPD